MNERVALLVNNLAGGGAERVMVLLANGLAQAGLAVDFVAIRAQGPNRELLDQQVTLVDLNASRLGRGIMPLVNYLKRNRPRALLSALALTNVAAIIATRLARTNTYVVVSEHSYPPYDRQHSQYWQVRLAHRIAKLIYRHADHVVAVSQGVRQYLQDHYRIALERLSYIYNPVIPNDVAARMAQTPNHPWLCDVSTPVILSAGRLDPVKNYTLLIDAFATLRQKRSARLIILGQGPERSKLQSRIKHHQLQSDVDLVGYVANPYAWMAHASVFALSSRAESFGNVLIESLACGTPVVATNCPCGPAELLDHGRYGRLVPLDDVACLTQALADALDDPGDLNAGTTHAMQFSIARAVSQYIAILQKASHHD